MKYLLVASLPYSCAVFAGGQTISLKNTILLRNICKFMHLFPSVMPAYSLPLARREVQVRVDGNCFYRAVALALNGKTDKEFGHIKEMCNMVMTQNSATFRPYLFQH